MFLHQMRFFIMDADRYSSILEALVREAEEAILAAEETTGRIFETEEETTGRPRAFAGRKDAIFT